MDDEIKLLVFFILLLSAFILFSVLGTRNVTFGIEGMESNTSSQVFYGPNGATAQIQTDSNGQSSLVVVDSNGGSTTYTANDASSTTYTGPNGGTAKIIDTNGTKSLVVTDSNGSAITYNGNTGAVNTVTNYDNYNHYSGTAYYSVYYGPDGGTAKIVQTSSGNTIVVTNKNGSTETYTADKSTTVYYGPNGGSAKIITDTNGKQAIEITTPNGSKVVYTGENAYTYNSQDDTINQYDVDNSSGSDYNTVYGPNGGQATVYTGPNGNTYATYDSSAYYNSLPPGIPRSQIPPGDEDLYILKSQVVPPVCPKCPDPIVTSSTDVSKCPPCPAPSRCPEPAYECKKVPTYSSFNPDRMPVPVLSDFSGFGM